VSTEDDGIHCFSTVSIYTDLAELMMLGFCHWFVDYSRKQADHF
jgi:hypothetical protein